jgi:hypothetical protein
VHSTLDGEQRTQPEQKKSGDHSHAIALARKYGREKRNQPRALVASADVSYGSWTPPGELPFSNIEAEYLIGLSFRLTLRSILWVTQEREDLGVLKTERTWFRRWAAYQEMFDYGFEEYFYAFVLPYYRDRLHYLSDADERIAANDLRVLTPALRGNAKVRVFVNKNDFLRTEDDEAWLERMFGRDHVTMLFEGGHLGGLHKPEIQRQIINSLSDLTAGAR